MSARIKSREFWGGQVARYPIEGCESRLLIRGEERDPGVAGQKLGNGDFGDTDTQLKSSGMTLAVVLLIG